ncbi:MAG TPA: hypothetical protein VLA82_09850 [Actinomycetota bacterium]|nr:hypothetical protein [Actinomycetota bacterium]
MRRVPALIALAVVLAACGAGAGDGPSPTDTAGAGHGTSVGTEGARPSTDATLRIVSPTDDETVGPTVDVEIELDGARVVQQTSTELRPDEGHIHVLLDDQLVSMTDGLEQTLRDVGPGLHVLKVEFVANDHAPFDPRVIEAVAFEVRA